MYEDKIDRLSIRGYRQHDSLSVSSALLPQSLNESILAGLLTYSIFERPSHSLNEQWNVVLFKDFSGAYSSGSVQDLHLIPFSPLFRYYGKVTPKSVYKDILFL